jgi:two-component sensor histidine kinase/ligand-binding sensor domain-containing protein
MMVGRESGLKLIRLVLGIALSLAAAVSASGQSFQVRTYTEVDGLCSSVIQDVAQDARGQIWFATRGGISVFDGTSWTSYIRGRDLPMSSNVLRLTIDGNGTVWAWAENSLECLFRFSGGQWISISKPAFVADAIRPTAMLVHGDLGRETVALATRDQGLLVWNDGRWIQIGQKDGLPGPTVLGLARAGSRLYLATPGGLYYFENGRLLQFSAAGAPPLAEPIYGLAAEDSAFGPTLWLIGKTWLGKLSWEGFRMLSRDLVLHLDDAYPLVVLAPDTRGGVYYGNPNSVFHWRGAGVTAEKLGRDSGLIAEGATAFLLDREKDLWICSLRGANKISSRRFANFRKAQGLLEDEVTALIRWRGRLVFGHNRGLSFFDGTDFQNLSFPRPKGGLDVESRVLDLAVDPRGNLWAAATLRGLLRIAPDGSIRWFGPEAGIEGHVGSVATGPDGSVWVASRSTLVRMSGDRVERIFPDATRASYIRKIFIGRGGEMMLASSSGLWVREKSAWKQYLDPDPEKRYASNVYAALRTDDGRLLVGTMAGLREARDGRLIPYQAAGPAIERPVYLIIRDKQSRLWFGTDNGVVRWDGKESREYTVKSGLSGQEVNRSAGLVEQDGQIWVGTNMGASRYQEEFDFGPLDSPPPLVELRSLEAGGAPQPLTADLRLRFSQDDFDFAFRAVSVADETAIRFRFRLDGFDKDWVEERPGGAGHIRYTNLSAGTYRLSLQARSGEGRWSVPVSSPAITIRPPFWRQWWFIVVGSVFILLLAFLVFEIFAERRLAGRLEKEVGERTAQIRASLEEKDVLLREIHHRVKNNLQVVSSLLSLQADKTTDGPTRGLFRESMARVRAMALIHENLYRSPRLADIDVPQYIHRLCRDLQSTYAVQPDRVTIVVEAADIGLPMESAVTCGLLLNEMVSNALKHGFPEGRRGTIRIEFSVENGDKKSAAPSRTYRLVVADDGVGLPEGFQAKGFGSLGWRLIRSLTGQLGGTLAVENEGGARFTLRFRA